MKDYNPREIESKWYDYWEQNNFFSPDTQPSDETYSIVIPPPNVTGVLHIGHALVNTLQDILIRRSRMSGLKTLWLPGVDHAGIATQMVVERELKKKNIHREKLGREKFLEEVWKWKEESGSAIFRQLRRLGASCDWKRERFTLDEGLSKAVKKCFVDLYNEGLIYRGDYIVNWCPHDKTALSDLEVDHIEKDGTLTYISYPLAEEEGQIIVATTRTETMLGDTAVAVNPDDPRYQNLVGKKVRLPLVDRIIPIIADELIDMEFGTGAVKVTPAHDPNDFIIARKHNLPSINIFTKEAQINDVYPALRGLSRFEARKEVTRRLKDGGFFVKTEKHLHSVGHCQRCSTIVEPRLSAQWFCKMKNMADASLKAVKEGKLRLIPENQSKVFHEWLANIQDWCLSRQIWWGHRVPAWHCDDCGEIIVSEEDEIKCCHKCDSKNIRAETDVLDTWFSSGLFPFSTMGWPESTEDMKNFYPNSTLITGHDILFFWVARMVMMGIKMTGEVPFPEVFLHGLVRDEKGEKMSKTKGNVIDPLVIIDKFGADALRFTLAALLVMGKDIKLTEKDIENSRHFINKIWNAAKFALFHIERLGEPLPIEQTTPSIFDQWILYQLDQAVLRVNISLGENDDEYRDEYLSGYQFNKTAKILRAFIWGEFCDWYLEIIKPALFGKLGAEHQQASLSTLCYVLEKSLRLLHPIMPFVTEELWQKLPGTKGSIMLADFPTADKKDFGIETQTSQFIELVSVIRNIRGENNLKPNVKINIVLVSPSTKLNQNAEKYQIVLEALAGVKSLSLRDKFEKTKGWAGGVGVQNFEVFVDLREIIDKDQELNRLEKEKAKLSAKKAKLESKLGNQAFLNKAPAEIIEKNRAQLSMVDDAIDKIQDNINTIKGV